MLHPLSRETVLDAQQSTRRATRRLLLLLIVIYIVFFHLLAAGALLACMVVITPKILDLLLLAQKGPPWMVFLTRNLWILSVVVSIVALLVALAQFWRARRRNIYDVLMQMGGKQPDKSDQYHLRFKDIVEEAEVATGIRPIQANVIPSVGCNAFSIMDKYGNAAIGVTEGMVSTLSRPELSAVVAHEACHLVHGDTLLKTTACSLFSVFDNMRQRLGDTLQMSAEQDNDWWSRLTSHRNSSNDARGALGVIILWIIASLGAFCTNLVRMAISREREYLADAHAAQMCLEPLALADALCKISRRYRGGMDFPEGFSALFMVNPTSSARDENSGWWADLFSTHPPVADRVRRLLEWAKADVSALKDPGAPWGLPEPKSALRQKEPVTGAATGPAAAMRAGISGETLSRNIPPGVPAAGPIAALASGTGVSANGVLALASGTGVSVNGLAPSPVECVPGGAIPDGLPRFMAKGENNWVGPYTPAQLVAAGVVKPMTWIMEPGKPGTTQQALDNPLFLPLFKRASGGAEVEESQPMCPHCKAPLMATSYERAPAHYCTYCEGWLLRGGVLERIIARREETFTAQQIDEAKVWLQFKNPLAQKQMGMPEIKCPHCRGHMTRSFYSACYRVVVDRCAKPSCRSIWLDKGELETIQILVESGK